MSVEMAVCLPVLLAMVAVAFNLMVFLGDCARFDRAAAEVVRVRATSPGHGEYGLQSARDLIERDLGEMFEGQRDYLRPSVKAHSVAADETGQDGLPFSFLARQEVYECSFEYRPWGFKNRLFGVNFPGLTHTRVFVVDPFRPGALL
jgi:hypothetical protein